MNKKIMIYQPSIDWDSMVQTPHHIMKGFHREGYTCYFCDGKHDPKNYLTEVEPNFFVCRDYPRLKKEFKDTPVNLYISWAKYHSEIKDFNCEKVIYHYLDHFPSWEPYQKDMMQKADYIFCTADTLYKEAFEKHPEKTFLMSNGCDYNLFSVLRKDILFSDIIKIKKPIVMYYGAIAQWFDAKLVQEVAQLLPNYSFVFIGKTMGAILPNEPNIYYFGEKDYLNLPHYLKYAEVCIIPFIINKTIESTNPIKFYEYLAAGKPVVCTEMPELFKFKDDDVVRFAKDSHTFANHIIDLIFQKKTPLAIHKRQIIAKENSWDSKIEFMLSTINNTSEKEVKNQVSRKFEVSIEEKPKNPRKRVAILTRSFYDYDGKNIFMGGGERYLIDLGNILKSLNFDVEIFQHGNKDWKNTYKGFTFISIPGSVCKIDAIPGLTTKFNEITQDYDYHIYFSFDICFPETLPNSLAISHGISFDGPGVSGRGTQEWYDMLRKCVSNPVKIVTVDTNTINWARSAFSDLKDRFIYIPNYVNTEDFTPTKLEKDIKDFKVLFPRRIVIPRGWKEAQLAVDILANKYPDMSFYFVGRGFSEKDENKMLDWTNSFKHKNVHWSWEDMDDMNKVYADKDLIVIPTLWSEGTSLSCLEAMASGKPVISTCVGGLQNLIVNNYNGLLLEYATPEVLVESIEQLYFNREKCKLFGKRNREMAETCFNKERWEEQWIKVIKTYFT